MLFSTIKDRDFKKILEKMNPDAFLDYMLKLGMIDARTNDYGHDVHGLCNNACAWAVAQLQNTGYIYCLEVMHGTFDGYDHQWLCVGDCFIDLTLAQFVDASPRLAIVKRKDAHRYEIYKQRDAFKFIEELKASVTA